MNVVGSITSKCRHLVEGSSIAAEQKQLIRNRLDEIQKLIDEDSFAAQRAIFIALPQFQKMLRHAQLLHDSPSASAFCDVKAGSDGIINFLLTKKSRPVSTPPAGSQ